MDANVIFGAVIDPAMGDEMRITVIATGFGRSQGRPSVHLQEPADFAVTPTLGSRGARRMEYAEPEPMRAHVEAPRAYADPRIADVPRATSRMAGPVAQDSWTEAPIDAVPYLEPDVAVETRRLKDAQAAAMQRVRENLREVGTTAHEMSGPREPEPESVGAGHHAPRFGAAAGRSPTASRRT